jgi:signal transduction histidine kinase
MSYTGATLRSVSADDGSGTRERLAVIGEIAAEVAHELGNVLQIISASAYVARQEVDRGNADAAKPHVVKIEKHAREAHAIVQDVMALASGEPLRAEPVLLGEALVAARIHLAADSAVYDDTLEPQDLRVLAHPALLARSLHTLYENAIHASAPRRPTVTTRARAEQGRVVVDGGDDGPGVPAEIASRVFDPLVTARPGGTGLGLALARRIVEAHGGSIVLVQSRDRGATFRIELPGVG